MKIIIITTMVTITSAGSFALGYNIGQTKGRSTGLSEGALLGKRDSRERLNNAAQHILNKKPYPDGSQYLTKDEWESLHAVFQSDPSQKKQAALGLDP